MEQDKKTSPRLTLLQIILPIIGTFITAYFGYQAIKYQVDAPIQATQSATNSTSEAVIKVEVVNSVSGEKIPNATVILQIGVMPSKTEVTGSDGAALFYLNREFIGQHGSLRVEAKEYVLYNINITVDEKTPVKVPLERVDSTSPNLPPTISGNSGNNQSAPITATDTNEIPMAVIPAGNFTMGADSRKAQAECQKYRNDCDINWFLDEEPIHSVYLNEFKIDKYEVTNGFYKTCVDAGVCSKPANLDFYNNIQYDKFPVVYVDWYQAFTYCEWRGARLPTEAEWEKAARGATDERMFPWGQNIDCNRAQYYGCGRQNLIAVGSYGNGTSPYGLYDMAGNVWEWVNDWYSQSYYSNSPASNPQGIDTGKDKTMRGGAWNAYPYEIRTTHRSNRASETSNYTLGFRCAGN